MSSPVTFLAGLGITLGVSLAVVAYLRPHLRRILVDLCGTQDRAEFWAAFSNVTLILVPLICAMFHRPLPEGTSILFEFSAQLRWALIGLVIAVVLLGVVISRFVPREKDLKKVA